MRADWLEWAIISCFFLSCTHYTHAIYERKKEWEKINSLHYSSLDDIDAFLIIETSPWDSQHQCGPFHSKNFMTNRKREVEKVVASNKLIGIWFSIFLSHPISLHISRKQIELFYSQSGQSMKSKWGIWFRCPCTIWCAKSLKR